MGLLDRIHPQAKKTIPTDLALCRSLEPT